MAPGGFAVRDSYQTPKKQNVQKKGEEGKGEEDRPERQHITHTSENPSNGRTPTKMAPGGLPYVVAMKL